MSLGPHLGTITQIITTPQGLVAKIDGWKNPWPVPCLALVSGIETGEQFVLPMAMSPDGDIQLLYPGERSTVKVFIKNSQEEHNGRQSKEG